MPVTSPDGIWSPDSGDDYALTVDLARMADDMQEALLRRSPVVGSAAARNSLFPSPQQGDRVWRSDLGYEETYYDTYNAIANPGGLVSANWYPPSKIFMAQNNAGQALGGGWNVITSAWGAASVNHLGVWSGGALTVTKPGWYEITFGVHLANPTATGSVQITRNSTAPDTAGTLASEFIGASTTALRTTTMALLSGGDAIRGLAYTIAANSLNGFSWGSHLSLRLVNG